MKKWMIGVLSLLLVLSVFAPTAIFAEEGPEIDSLLRNKDKLQSLFNGLDQVRVILTYDQQPTADDVAALKDLGLKTHTFDHLPMVAVQGPYSTIEELFTQENLRSIYTDKKLEFLMKDSGPYIEADRVWSELGYTGKEVGVAIIDSGIDATHPDLTYGEKTVHNVKILGNNFFTGDLISQESPNTDTSSGHGTHVAGTIGGTASASDGTYKGVAPDSKLIGIGTGDALFILYALEGFDYALENQEKYNIQVISNSWGTTGEYTANDPINVASKKAHDAGMTVTFAAGNEGSGENTLNPYSVAPWVIGVAAGTKEGKLADFSSRGVPGDALLHPTLTAPGVDIVSTRASTGSTINALTAADDATYIENPLHIPFYTTASGTSMATPHISGVVALMKEANPKLTPDIVKDILVRTARPMEGYQPYEVGAGYVDAYDATAMAKNAKIRPPKPGNDKPVPTYEVTENWDEEMGPSADGTPVKEQDEKIVTIGEKAVSATIRIEWTNPTTDLDIYVYGPDGSLVGKSTQGVSTSEETTIPNAQDGGYKVVVDGYLSAVEPYKGIATIEYALR